jgi:class 3 adenylate cyclase
VGAIRVTASLGGVRLEWDEDPFSFIEPERYWVRRRMLRGPIAQFNGGMRFVAEGECTVVHVESELVPASAVGHVLIQGLCAKTRRACDRLMRGVEEHLAGAAATAFGTGVDRALPSAREATLTRLREADGEFLAQRLAPRLCEHLADAGELHLTRLRPFGLARLWGEDPYEVLRLFLQGAYVGVLDLSWDLLCPNCGGAQSRFSRLEMVESAAHCDSCQIRFDATFDRAVEATFRPNARIRNIPDIVYCSGGPRNTPHLVAQTVLDRGESASLTVTLRSGRYRLRNLTAAAAMLLDVEPQAGTESELPVRITDNSMSMEPQGAVVGAGRVTLSLENRSSTRQQVVLERTAANEDVATAAAVTLYQEFRDLFGREALSPSTQLGIRTLPLMFTDLKGSTELYTRMGTAPAYALVRDHFSALHSLVAQHHGGVVKTIGDAVMAAFPTAADAMACALGAREALRELNATAGEPLRLKIGLHQGPCIAVRSYDDRLDYFGSTVNLAARTHEQSRGDDIVITREMLDAPDVASLVAEVPQEPYLADLRGIGEVTLIRLRPWD